ncbi:RNA polymerase II mediator complex subunit [Rhizina undulata]
MAMSTQRQQQQQRDHRPPYANLLPQQRNVANPAFHFSPEAPNFNAAVKSPMANKPPQYPPSLVLQCAPEDSMVAGLTTTNIPQNSNAQPRPTATSTPGENDAPNAARNAGNGMTGGTDVFSGFNGVGNFNGSATNGVNDAGGGMIESNPFRPKASIKNSRHGKRLGFTVQDTLPQPPQFVQPSRVYSRKPGTPPILPPALGNTRQKLFQPQPAKSEFAKPGLRRDTKPKPYVLEPPAAAQLYPNLRCSDFFPWRGNHPGDHVTDAQAKNGQYDKLSVGKSNVPMSGVGSTELALTVYQNEQASARASIGPLFRKNNGLSTLSGLFSTVLEKRERYSRLTAMSSFKPPPRVTLPDQKRESWLRDLANPLVPLRKLSRTIPHGLKGSVLLDQCAAKNIPTPRAVWFARCVGANELRGLKRKGVGSFAVGSEAKWIREWTSQVQHFLDKQISGCGGPAEGWRSRMVYAVRLSAHLYADHLLDRNQFLEWYIGFLEKASLDTLPLAYLISRIFWSDLNKTRKLARRHAEALLAKVEVV